MMKTASIVVNVTVAAVDLTSLFMISSSQESQRFGSAEYCFLLLNDESLTVWLRSFLSVTVLLL